MRLVEFDPAFDDDVPSRVGDREKPVALARRDRVLAHDISELIQDRGLQFLGGSGPDRPLGIAADDFGAFGELIHFRIP